MNTTALPLSRFTVLDLTRVRAGPTAVRQLADWGANVIKIESPAHIDTERGMGGARHGPDFQNLHRNKRSMTLNLKDPEGHAVFMRMVDYADVVVENYRPDVKNRLGINYAALSARNPKVVLGSVSGFGQDGPYVDRPGFDQIAQGMGGLMSSLACPGRAPSASVYRLRTCQRDSTPLSGFSSHYCNVKKPGSANGSVHRLLRPRLQCSIFKRPVG